MNACKDLHSEKVSSLTHTLTHTIALASVLTSSKILQFLFFLKKSAIAVKKQTNRQTRSPRDL